MIKLTGVGKSYGRRGQIFHALKDIDLVIPTGSSVAIVGKSGSGKSTLMHVMSGLDKPQVGEIVIEGRDILKLDQKAVDRFRSEKIGFIFQAFFVQGNETCFDNVSLPLEIADVSRSKRSDLVESALEQVELIDKRDSRASDLSGGQKQRLAIARAIVGDPEVLFADEPTGNLDSTTGATIQSLLFKLNREKGVTLVIVTHDHELAAQCDMQVHIRDGIIHDVTRKKAKATL